MNPINCLTALTSIAYLRWASKSLLPQVPGAPMDVAIAQVRLHHEVRGRQGRTHGLATFWEVAVLAARQCLPSNPERTRAGVLCKALTIPEAA